MQGQDTLRMQAFGRPGAPQAGPEARNPKALLMSAIAPRTAGSTPRELHHPKQPSGRKQA